MLPENPDLRALFATSEKLNGFRVFVLVVLSEDIFFNFYYDDDE
jgi:hypothetical protein